MNVRLVNKDPDYKASENFMYRTKAFARIVLKFKIPKLLYTDILWSKVIFSMHYKALANELKQLQKSKEIFSLLCDK